MSELLPRGMILNAVQKASKTLDTEHLTDLQEKLGSDKSISELFQLLIQTFIDQINKLKTGEVKTDYEALEESVQRSQQEIRKHIRIEQQMKLYSDSLEQKIDALEHKIQKQKEFIEGLKLEKEELKSKIRLSQPQTDSRNKSKSRSRIHTESVGQNSSLHNLKRTINFSFQHKLRKREGDLHQKMSRDMMGMLPQAQPSDKVDMLKKREPFKANLRKKIQREAQMYKTIDCYETEPPRFHQSLVKKRQTLGSIPRKDLRTNSVSK